MLFQNFAEARAEASSPSLTVNSIIFWPFSCHPVQRPSFLPSSEQRKGVGKDPLRWEDVKLDWDAPHIEIRPETSKTEDRRLIPICPTLLAWLQLLHKGTGRITPLKSPFRRHHNEPSITDELARAAGVEKWKVNANRHSFGSYRTAITKDLGLVSL